MSVNEPTFPNVSKPNRNALAQPTTASLFSTANTSVERSTSITRTAGNGKMIRLTSSSEQKFPHIESYHANSNDTPAIRWKRGEMLGQGAFGVVYLGLNIDTGELMAVKQITIDEASTKLLSALENEIYFLRSLRHPNIVRYIDTELTTTALSIFLEYVPGGSLKSLIDKFGSLEESVTKSYTRQLLLGLEYLHRNGIAHRDIKGANCLVGNDGVVKLADFGNSKHWRPNVSIDGTGAPTENSGDIKGTPSWMAPEVIRDQGGPIQWKKSDVWSLACTTLEMRTGKPPWSQFTNPVTILYHIACQDTLPDYPDPASPELVSFLNVCLQRDPTQRPDTTSLLLHPFVSGSAGNGLWNSAAGGGGAYSNRPTTVSTTPSGGGADWENAGFWSGHGGAIGGVSGGTPHHGSGRYANRANPSNLMMSRPYNNMADSPLATTATVTSTTMNDFSITTDDIPKSISIASASPIPATVLGSPRKQDTPRKRSNPRIGIEELDSSLLLSTNEPTPRLAKPPPHASSAQYRPIKDHNNHLPATTRNRPKSHSMDSSAINDGIYSNSEEDSISSISKSREASVNTELQRKVRRGPQQRSDSGTELEDESPSTVVSSFAAESLSLSLSAAAAEEDTLAAVSQGDPVVVLSLVVPSTAQLGSVTAERKSARQKSSQVQAGTGMLGSPQVQKKRSGKMRKGNATEANTGVSKQQVGRVSAKNSTTKSTSPLKVPSSNGNSSQQNGLIIATATAATAEYIHSLSPAKESILFPITTAPQTSQAAVNEVDQPVDGGATTITNSIASLNNSSTYDYEKFDNIDEDLFIPEEIDNIIQFDNADESFHFDDENIRVGNDAVEIDDDEEDEEIIHAVNNSMTIDNSFVAGEEVNASVSAKELESHQFYPGNTSVQSVDDDGSLESRDSMSLITDEERKSEGLMPKQEFRDIVGHLVPEPRKKLPSLEKRTTTLEKLSLSPEPSIVSARTALRQQGLTAISSDSAETTGGLLTNRLKLNTETAPPTPYKPMTSSRARSSNSTGNNGSAWKSSGNNSLRKSDSHNVLLGMSAMSVGESIELGVRGTPLNASRLITNVGDDSSSVGSNNYDSSNGSRLRTKRALSANSNVNNVTLGTATASYFNQYINANEEVDESVDIMDRIDEMEFRYDGNPFESLTPHLLEGHTSAVTKLRNPLRTDLLVSGSMDGTIRIWGTSSSGESTMECRQVLECSNFDASLGAGQKEISNTTTGVPTSAASKSNLHKVVNVWAEEGGSTLWSACSDKSIRVWSGQEGRPYRVMKGHDEPILAMEGSSGCGNGGNIASSSAMQTSELVATGSADKTVRLWDARAKKPQVLLLRGHSDSVVALKWIDGGRSILSASKDKTVRIWDTRAGRLRQTLERHFGAVTALRSIPDSYNASSTGQVAFVSAGRDSMINLWSTAGDCLTTLTAHKGTVSYLSEVSFEWQGRQRTPGPPIPVMISTGSDNCVKIWDLKKMKLLSELSMPAGTGGVMKTVWVGRSLVTCSSSGAVRLYSFAATANAAAALAPCFSATASSSGNGVAGPSNRSSLETTEQQFGMDNEEELSSSHIAVQQQQQQQPAKSTSTGEWFGCELGTLSQPASDLLCASSFVVCSSKNGQILCWKRK